MSPQVQPRIAVVIGSILFASIIGAVPSNGFDSTPPSLGAVTVSQNSLPETGGTVIVTAQITSNAYGLDQAPLFVLQQDGYSKNFSCTRPLAMRMALVAGDDKNGSYRCEVDLFPPLKPGVYKLLFFPLSDKGGNSTGNFISTSFSIAVGVIPVPTPTPIPAPAPSKNQQKPVETGINQESFDALVSKNAELISQLNALQAKLRVLMAVQAKYTKICSAKIKPKGC
jgi:hypothetical protein